MFSGKYPNRKIFFPGLTRRLQESRCRQSLDSLDAEARGEYHGIESINVADKGASVSEPTRITVAIPTFNGARHLGETLRSILAQEFTDFDLLVRDDRSEDDTLELVRRIAGSRATISVNERRLGLAGNWNACLRDSKTAWTAIFHQDDLMLPGHLSEHLQAIVENPDAGIVASATSAIDESGREISSNVVDHGGLGKENRRYGPGEMVKRLATRNPLRCSSITLRNAAFESIGGFDARYRYVVDWDAWLKIARAYPVVWRARETVAFRWHPASETSRLKCGTVDLEESARLLETIWNEDFRKSNEWVRLRKEGKRRLARAYLNRAYDAARAGNPTLTRATLRKAIALSPSLVGRILIDPRLTARFLGTIWRKTGTSGREDFDFEEFSG